MQHHKIERPYLRRTKGVSGPCKPPATSHNLPQPPSIAAKWSFLHTRLLSSSSRLARSTAILAVRSADEWLVRVRIELINRAEKILRASELNRTRMNAHLKPSYVAVRDSLALGLDITQTPVRLFSSIPFVSPPNLPFRVGQLTFTTPQTRFCSR